ncbi:RNA-binding protein, putative [Plasmodium knowlesi strain H]|uniref:RNA-binding protein, putative n=3 Tax=Plasmodium knowlesi TaxID=5850 RepID=A0A5K1U7D0_PLAKH|nr:RNA-binding protein, putative [Plasmodium knowlesi strain H]OTN67943.1 putative RNA-binding protein [Plasmodium knowlesi]CAA9990210.1 RNA-binding protein, putative [Plasmodium knowlesi strain H]SBO26854.1 RNA-binding protein, putative [Plasmodium knowlesi strain H]SBO28466.1 RNA-binding protein, putative [Plasmodium knowlesi strain H]VVS79684.1 RNA-binding protein, putative [Plasmodium knowlesi strain H]|eukprot:XP_002258091.1 rna-binding protein, putative [Plasmodium knowlesi strain H]
MSAANSTKIFIGSIPKDVTEEELKTEASKYGVITQVYYVPATVQNPRGWAFITYKERSEAYKAIEALDYKSIFPNSQRPLDVRFASYKHNTTSETQPAPNKNVWQKHVTSDGHPYYYNSVTGHSQWEKPKESVTTPPSVIQGKANTVAPYGPPGANVFVFHVPSHWTDMELYQHFQHFGYVLSARIQRDSSGRNKGYGFVSFNNPESAMNAIKGMHGFYVSGKHLKVQLKKGEEHYMQLNGPVQPQMAPTQPYTMQQPIMGTPQQPYMAHMMYTSMNSSNQMPYNNTYSLSR